MLTLAGTCRPQVPRYMYLNKQIPFNNLAGRFSGMSLHYYRPSSGSVQNSLQARVGQCSIPQVVFVFLFYIFLHPISPFVEYAFKCDPALFECKQASSCIYGRSCGEIRLPSSSKEQTAPVFSRLVEASSIVALAGCCVLQ